MFKGEDILQISLKVFGCDNEIWKYFSND